MAKTKVPKPKKYKLDFDENEWNEIGSLLALLGIEVARATALPRTTWVAVGFMCLGKADQIEAGYYGEDDEDEGFNCAEWAADLNGIAQQIFEKFGPGDGQY